MDTLFKYISEETSAKKFKDEIEQYNKTSNMHKKMIDDYDEIYNDVEREKQLGRYTAEIYRIREDIDKILDEYKKSGNREFLNTAMDMYVTDLVPKIQQMRLTKYENVYVETISEDPPVTKLVSNEISIYHKDVIWNDESKVIRFTMEH
jgi:predicted GTPase